MIGVTGANGYVGGRILSHLRASGIEAVALVRRPARGDESARTYALEEPLRAGVLDGIEVVVHAAYDLSQRGERVRAVNVAGSLPLLEGLAGSGGRVVLVSSLAAFDGARSLYGQAKRELEHAVLERGGVAVRPGLVFGAGAGGLFGTMAAAVGRYPVVPLVGGGWQRLFVTHDQQLCELVATLAAGPADGAGPLFAAHEVPTTLRAIVLAMAAAHGRRLKVLPVPSWGIRLALSAADAAGAALPHRGDSLRSLLNPVPLDQVSALARGSVEFPPLRPEIFAR